MQYHIEKRLLSACVKARSSFDEVFSRILPEKFSPVGSSVADLIRDYYENDKDAKSVDRDVILDRAATSRGNPNKVLAITDYIESLDPEISIPNLMEDVKLYRQQKLGDEIVIDLVNQINPAVVAEKMMKYQDVNSAELEEDEEIFIGQKVSALIRDSFSKENLIKLLPKELNDRVDGGCRPGHHLLVYARPEIGKTLFVINMTAGFLLQNLKVLYIGNEDPASDILMRIISRLSRMTKTQIMENPDGAEAIAFERGYGNLVVAALSPGNFFEIRKLVEKYNPAVVILDQLRNLEVNSESRVLALEKAAMEARNLGKKFGLVVVSVTQAGDSAEGKVVLGRSDIDFSKTGIPSALDLMIGIGADETMEKHGLRTISLAKNKLSGNHEYFTVSINPQLGLVEST